MTYLLVKEKNNKFTLYSPETFGMDSWGDIYHQTSLKKKKKYWYIESWSAGNEWTEDSVEQFKLTVVLETKSLQEVLNYVIKDTKGSQAAIGSVLVQAQEIYHDWVEFENWCAKNSK